ncbi:hypothetical protein SY83_10860 [Paenibacillus swuensis]|uniref:Uncharacterized protein n=1 Tax=Paenibacillus swuensis TaxID=1178515 RepID=A0A172TI10_9BACL|nr:DUF5693 family protein [Paenibacillus swuensis]ANE46688.1 hypothetical protein SY83_10860 [Paenibacillus swuensis]
MLRTLLGWNDKFEKVLWILVILGIVASLPIAYQRVQTERSSKNVEMVFDYRDLADMAAVKLNPQAYIQEHLKNLKDAGFTSMAVYDSSLGELRNSRRLQLFNTADYAALTGTALAQDRNHTYLLFANQESAEKLKPIITAAFARIEAGVEDWNWKGQQGLVLQLPFEESVMQTFDPDPFALQNISEAGFDIVARISDRRSNLTKEDIDHILGVYRNYGTRWIIFDGTSVTGFSNEADQRTLSYMGEALKKNGMGIAAIEMLKKPIEGFSKLAYAIDYDVVRLNSLSDTDAWKSPSVLSDRQQLAVKDRNIRMLYYNAEVVRNYDKGVIKDPMENLYLSLKGDNGVFARIQDAGYSFGTAEPFDYVHSDWQRYLKLLVITGGVAFITLLIALFLPVLSIPVFVVGMIGAAGLTVVSPELLSKALALGVSIAAPSVAVILAVRTIQNMTEDQGVLSRWTKAVTLFLRTAIISLMAVPFIIALLNAPKYMLVLDQFRGVSLLHAAPIALVAVYIVLFTSGSLMSTLRTLLNKQITVLWVVLAGILGVAGMYYLSRTGNEGSASSIELLFRSVLENTFGVRPRTKEFMLAHPIFILAAYVAIRGVKYRSAMYLFIFAVIGQLSMVDTFAHLHSPIHISVIRVLLGIGIGIILSVIYVAAWEILVRGWKRWAPQFKS